MRGMFRNRPRLIRLAVMAAVAGLLVVMVGMQSLFTRLRIDQTVGLWWRYGMLLVLGQWLLMIVFA